MGDKAGTPIAVNVSRPRRVRNRLNYNINTIIIIILVLLLVWNNVIVHNDGVRYGGANIC